MLQLSKVYYIPQWDMNLISCIQLDDKGITVSFSNGRCMFMDLEQGNKTLMYAKLRLSDRLYSITLMLLEGGNIVQVGSARSQSKANAKTWHKGIGHVSKDVVEMMSKQEKYGMVINDVSTNDGCETCVIANQTKSNMKGGLVFDYDDIYSPFRTATLGGRKKFATFLIAKSRYFIVAL